jgi:hypothetical protein
MVHLKSFKKFYEDATANASNTSGMGAVVSSQAGAFAGNTGTEGSGDIGVVLDTKSKKRKKGDPSKVSDLRDLKPVKTNKIEESTQDKDDMIKGCLVELFDERFELGEIRYLDGIRSVAHDNYRNEKESLENNIFSVELYKYNEIRKKGIDNEFFYGVIINFDKTNGFHTISEDTLYPYDRSLIEISEDAFNKVINTINYDYGIIYIENVPIGEGNQVNITFNLERN